jgi:hypothetical protein
VIEIPPDGVGSFVIFSGAGKRPGVLGLHRHGRLPALNRLD